MTEAQRVEVPRAAVPAPQPDTGADVRIAWLHLRLGMLGAARAELEDLERRGDLDREGRAALAEARWRTGDLEAAGEAARAHLDAGGLDPVATIVAAEDAAAAGEVAVARQLVERLRRLDAGAIDALFAGMPRRASWPAATAAAGAANAGASAAAAGSRSGGQGTPSADAARPAPGAPSSSIPGPEAVLAATARLWDANGGSGGATGAGRGAPDAAGRRGAGAAAGQAWVEPARPRGHADPDAELDLAREELSASPERGLLRLALVLRLDPTLAPDVLDALRLRREPLAALLRGDAERLVGRHLEAEAAFADAAEAIERDALASRPATGHHMPPDHQEDS
jgi:hypothetical protein